MKRTTGKENIFFPAEPLFNFINSILLKLGVRKDVAHYVAEGLIQASLRGVDSHGIRLLPHYISAVKGGRLNLDPNYKFKRTSLSTGILDADHTFGHAAGMEAAKKAIQLAREAGAGHVAVKNSSHFGAAAYYALEIAKADMIGMSFTNTDALIKTHGGKRPFLGNNPICFTAPCKGEEPFCLDMSTSIVTFNKIRQLRDEGSEAPLGVGFNKEGIETTDPNEIVMLSPMGSYKGYGLSLAVEILCSLLTGMPFGPHIPKMFEAPMSQRRCLGHFVSALRIDCFQDKNIFKQRISRLISEIRNEPSLKRGVPVQVAGDPEKRNFAQRIKKGIPLQLNDYEIFKKLSEEYAVPFKKIGYNYARNR